MGQGKITREEREYPERPIASVAACVFNSDRILLIKRGTPPSQGLWSVPGGAIELGESLRYTAKREVEEECGIEIKVDDVFDVENIIIRDESDKIQYHYVVTYVTADYVSGDIRPGADELDVRWATREELSDLDMNPTVRKMMLESFDTLSAES